MGAVANVIVAIMGWRALQGQVPAESGPLSFMMRLLGGGIFLVVFGPRILAAITR
jgi:hypothetical protein